MDKCVQQAIRVTTIQDHKAYANQNYKSGDGQASCSTGCIGTSSRVRLLGYASSPCGSTTLEKRPAEKFELRMGHEWFAGIVKLGNPRCRRHQLVRFKILAAPSTARSLVIFLYASTRNTHLHTDTHTSGRRGNKQTTYELRGIPSAIQTLHSPRRRTDQTDHRHGSGTILSKDCSLRYPTARYTNPIPRTIPPRSLERFDPVRLARENKHR